MVAAGSVDALQSKTEVSSTAFGEVSRMSSLEDSPGRTPLCGIGAFTVDRCVRSPHHRVSFCVLLSNTNVIAHPFYFAFDLGSDR